MDVITLKTARELSEQQGDHLLSLYMPTHRTGREMKQDRIRLQNLLRDAEQQLVDRGIRRPNALAMLKPLADLLADDHYWQHCLDGLAAFCMADECRIYRLPMPFDEELHVGERLYLKPLLPLLNEAGEVLVLALSQDSARLYRLSRYEIEEVELPEIRKIEVDGRDETLNYHAYSAARVGGATDTAMYHGHGGPDDRAKVDALNFFHQVNRAVNSVLGEDDSAMILACVAENVPLYQKANSYRRLLDAAVTGGSDRWKLSELHAAAWQATEDHRRNSERQALETFQSSANGQQAALDVSEVALAATQGRVKTLFVQNHADSWGRIDAAHTAVELADQPTDDAIDLLDFTANETLRYGGEVYTLDEIPSTDSPMAAILRH